MTIKNYQDFYLWQKLQYWVRQINIGMVPFLEAVAYKITDHMRRGIMSILSKLVEGEACYFLRYTQSFCRCFCLFLQPVLSSLWKCSQYLISSTHDLTEQTYA